MSGQTALDGVNVLDLSESIGGAYCTKLLADLGASIILVERPGSGHPLREAGPFSKDLDIEGSGLFLYYGANKKSVVCDIETESGQRTVRDLASGAEIVVESFAPGHLDALGLGYESLSALNPSLIMTSVTHFGQTGPYRHWKSDEIVDNAMGGYMYFMGHADREPLTMSNNQPMLHAGSQAAIATLAALWWMRKSGRGQHIDVSSVEAMLSAHAWTSAAWTHEGDIIRRSEPDCIRCKDGWVWFFTWRFEPTMFILIDRPELIDDPGFSDSKGWFDNRGQIIDLLKEWCADHTMEEIFRAGQELRIAVTPVNDSADLLKSEQLRARDWFQQVDHPVAGRTVLPGFPYQFGRSPASVRSPAPSLDENSDDEFTRRSQPFSADERVPLAGTGLAREDLPLSGVRMLEITANWAGPLAARYLADLGAEVIKIEAPRRPATRAVRYPGADPFRRHYNRSAYFNKFNRNKLGIALDLTHADGRELFLRLVEQSDVVLENNSPRVMRNFDLEYPVLKKANPRIIMVSISGFGQTGPDRDYVAYGANIEASCGLAAATGYPDDDRPYRTMLFYADPVTGGHAAIAIIAALHYRARTGNGQYVDMSLHENGITFFPENLIEYTTTGNLTPRRGNRHARFAPQGCYQTMGNDSWIVLTVRSLDEWKALTEVLGRPDLWDHADLREASGRMSRHDELDTAISDWTSQYDHNEAAAMLQRAGVPAGPVLANWELVSNPHLHARGFYVPIEHPDMGVFPYPGMPWKLSETPGQIRAASPLFGQHTRQVFQDILGLDEDDLRPLYDQWTIADEPHPDLPGPIIPTRRT